MENTINSDTDSNDYDSSDVSGHDMGNFDECEPYNDDGITAWGSANEYFFTILRLTTTGAAHSLLLQFEPRNGKPVDWKRTGLVLKRKYHNTSRQRRRTHLRRLNKSMMRAGVDPDVFLSEVHHLCDQLGDLDKVVSIEQSTTIILDALPAEKYSTIKIQGMRYLNLNLNGTEGIMKPIFVNHFIMSSVTKKSQDSNRKGRDSGHSNEDCHAQKSDMAKLGNFDNGRQSWCNTTVEAIRMTNIVTRKEIVNVRTAMLLTVIVEITKRS